MVRQRWRAHHCLSNGLEIVPVNIYDLLGAPPQIKSDRGCPLSLSPFHVIFACGRFESRHKLSGILKLEPKMPLSNGRTYLAIPGPSAMPDRVLNAMHRAAPNIYEGDLVEMSAGLVPDLKSVARTRHEVAIYIANGHGTWEAAIANTIGPGDHVLVLATGPFCKGWGEMADAIGAKVEVLDFGLEAPIDLARVSDRLDQDKSHQIKAVMTVHVDTGTSLKNDVKGLRDALDANDHPALLMVDCIASLGCDRFEMDAWGVDVMITASQKGLMTPPGLGFVFFNDRADAVRGQMQRVSRYWDWRPRANPQIFSHRWNGTAPTHHLFALREALDMIAEESLEAVWQRHENLAKMYWAAFDAWSAEPGELRMNVKRSEWRSHAVTALRMPAPKATELRRWTEHKAGVTLGIGLGLAPADDPAWHGLFRVGHMGHVNAHMVLGVVGTIDAGLKALGIPHGAGASEAAAQIAASAA